MCRLCVFDHPGQTKVSTSAVESKAISLDIHLGEEKSFLLTQKKEINQFSQLVHTWKCSGEEAASLIAAHSTWTSNAYETCEADCIMSINLLPLYGYELNQQLNMHLALLSNEHRLRL